ncbi:hypothetical protein FPOAC2_13271 [Fusarium poae]|jgi:hypothetical protein
MKGHKYNLRPRQSLKKPAFFRYLHEENFPWFTAEVARTAPLDPDTDKTYIQLPPSPSPFLSDSPASEDTLSIASSTDLFGLTVKTPTSESESEDTTSTDSTSSIPYSSSSSDEEDSTDTTNRQQQQQNVVQGIRSQSSHPNQQTGISDKRKQSQPSRTDWATTAETWSRKASKTMRQSTM